MHTKAEAEDGADIVVNSVEKSTREDDNALRRDACSQYIYAVHVKPYYKHEHASLAKVIQLLPKSNGRLFKLFIIGRKGAQLEGHG